MWMWQFLNSKYFKELACFIIAVSFHFDSIIPEKLNFDFLHQKIENASRSHDSCYEIMWRFVDFSRLFYKVNVHMLYLFNGCIHGEFVGLFLGLTEDNGSAVAAAVNLDHVSYHRRTLRPVASYGQMLQKTGRRQREIDEQRKREVEVKQGV